MDSAPVRPAAARSASFEDGFGQRVLVADRATGETLEYLHFKPELAAIPAFVNGVRDRIARFARLDDPRFAPIRRLETLPPDTPGGPERLALVSGLPTGDRLADILRTAQEHDLSVDIGNLGLLVGEMVGAVAYLHRTFSGTSHGSIGPERIFVTPESGIVLTDYVFGSALDALGLPRDRVWHQFRLVIPAQAGRLRIDRRTDAMQIGMVVLSLLLARPIREEEFPARLPDLIASAVDNVPDGREGAMGKPLRVWLACALQLDPRHNFTSAIEAENALDEWLPAEARPKTPVLVPAKARTPDSLPTPDQTGPAMEWQAPTPVSLPPDDTSRVVEDIVEPLAQATEPVVPAPVRSSGQVPAAESPEGPRPPFAVFSPPATSRPAPARLPSLPVPLRVQRRSLLLKISAALAAVAVVVAIGVPGVIRYLQRSEKPSGPGVVSITSSPEGVEMLLDGKLQGTTPLEVTVPSGTHSFEFRSDVRRRVIPVTIAPGERMTQIVDLRDTQRLGLLEVRSQPPGAQVLVDGRIKGASPLSMDLRAGAHTVLVTLGSASVQQRVTVQPGRVLSLIVPLQTGGDAALPKPVRR